MLQVGFGVGDITPAPGSEMPGGFFKRTGKGAAEKLLAVACVVHDGTTSVALVGIDALFVTRPVVEIARRQIQKETSIPGENVLIGASHTHTGGPIVTALGSAEDAAYLDKVAREVTAAVNRAWHSLHTAEIGIGTGIENSISFNRRFLMRDGREITHPGKPGTPHHADIVAPAGPMDPDVGVLAVRGPNSKIMGVVVNFACHNTVMGGELFTADYVGYLRKHLQAHYGENVPVVFLLGACGDITQVDNMSTAKEFGAEQGNLMGLKLASETVRTIDRMAWLKDAPLGAAVATVMVPIRPEPDADAERPAFGLGSGANIETRYAEERKLVAAERRKSPRLACEVQALRIGPLGIVTNGAEYFCEYALRIKKASRLTPTWFVSLANEYIGYVPTAQAFVGGGYEPRTARSSKLAIDGGQRLAEMALKALAKVGVGPAKPQWPKDIMAETPDTLIIGGGVIGLTTAYFLAREGLRVAVLDKSDFGQEASWAGAGILPPGNPARAQTPPAQLQAQSAALYLGLSAELRERTGIDNRYVRCGGLEFVSQADEAAANEWRNDGVAFETVAEKDLRVLEPALASGLGTAYHLPDMAQVRNPRHLKALLAGCRSLGVRTFPGCPVHGFELRGNRVIALRTDQGRLSAERFLLAAGAWTDSLLEQVGWRLGIQPVRGQIALLNTGAPLIRRILLWGSQYVVPRPDGCVLIGSTEEDAGFVKHTTAGAIADLLALACKLVPDLAKAPVERCWAGLRPGSPDGLPFLGQVPGFENLFVAAGHFRAGIQLSPATALLLKELLLGQPLTISLEPFRLDRAIQPYR